MRIGDTVVIRYNGDIVYFGQCYDGMVGVITSIYKKDYRISLDAKSRAKISRFNSKKSSDWTVYPYIPFKYVFAYKKKFGIRMIYNFYYYFVA